MALLNPQTAPTLKALEGLLLGSVKRQLKAKGHKATGKSLASLESNIVGFGDGLAIQIIGEDYLEYQDTGLKAGKRKGSSGSTVWIDALAEWVRKKGIESDMKKSRGIAFAIAKNMKRIGMHSKNSRLDLSKRNFLGDALKDVQPKIDEKLFEVFEKNFNLIVDKFVGTLDSK